MQLLTERHTWKSKSSRGMTPRLMRCPALGTSDGFFPFRGQLGGAVPRHRRLEPTIDSPIGGDVTRVAPVSDRQPGEVRGTERRRLEDFRTNDRDAQEVGLKLHEQIVGGGAAVDPQFRQLDVRIRFHRGEDLRALKGDRFERGSRDVAPARAARQAEYRATRVRIPMRRAQTRECRDQIDPAVVRDAGGEPLDFGGRANDPQLVAQPLHHRAADEHAAFECIIDDPVALPRDGRHADCFSMPPRRARC